MNYMLKKKLLALIFPTRCPLCNRFIHAHEKFCDNCYDSITIYKGNHSVRGAAAFTAAFEYDSSSSPAVLLLKRGIRGNAAYALGTALAETIKERIQTENIDFIVPVPMYDTDRKKRGFNQAELIAREVGRILGIDVLTDCVKKTRLTQNQKNLSARQRTVNLKKAFDVENSDIVRNKQILLIDDVCTTGSTLAEITKTLRQNGAAAVYCAACCKTPDLKKEDVENV